MAKSLKVAITLPHGMTVKAERLTDRTIRTVKDGDYLPASLNVRGKACTFYAKVVQVQGSRVWTVFGSTDRMHEVAIPKGSKVDVYRPI